MTTYGEIPDFEDSNFVNETYNLLTYIDNLICLLLLFIVSGPVLYYTYLKYSKREIYENDKKFLNKDDKYIIFHFIGTGKQYVINWRDFEFMDDNFFNNLVKYSEDNIIHYNTDKDYDIVKSIFQSIKYRKILITGEIHNKTNINDMVNILDEWCINDDILNEYIIVKTNEFDYKELQEEFIREKINLLSSKESIYLNNVFKCELCMGGFTELTNHKHACQLHKGSFVLHANKWGCCGNSKDHIGCIVGYHKKNMNENENDNNNINQIYNLFSN